MAVSTVQSKAGSFMFLEKVLNVFRGNGHLFYLSN